MIAKHLGDTPFFRRSICYLPYKWSKIRLTVFPQVHYQVRTDTASQAMTHNSNHRLGFLVSIDPFQNVDEVGPCRARVLETGLLAWDARRKTVSAVVNG